MHGRLLLLVIFKNNQTQRFSTGGQLLGSLRQSKLLNLFGQEPLSACPGSGGIKVCPPRRLEEEAVQIGTLESLRQSSCGIMRPVKLV
ncbi:UNVERIFIED_CONTAM: hypothetical protein FKN15_009488 [Acipenser sinensis]